MGDASLPALNVSDYAGKIYLNGQFVPSKSKETFSLKNPKDNSIAVEGIPKANAKDIDLAVRYAQEAFNGPWGKFSALQRTECLHKLGALMEEQLIPILTLDSYTSGNPVSLIPTREKNYIKNCILYYSGWTDKQKGDYLPDDDGKPFPVVSNLVLTAQASSSSSVTSLLVSVPPSTPSTLPSRP